MTEIQLVKFIPNFIKFEKSEVIGFQPSTELSVQLAYC